MKNLMRVLALTVSGVWASLAGAGEIPGFCGSGPWQVQAGCPEVSWWNDGALPAAAPTESVAAPVDGNAWALELNAEQDGLPDAVEDGQALVLAINRAQDGLPDGDARVAPELPESGFGIDAAIAAWAESIRGRLVSLKDLVLSAAESKLSEQTLATAGIEANAIVIYQPPSYSDAEAAAVVDEGERRWIASANAYVEDEADSAASVREVARTALRSAELPQETTEVRESTPRDRGWDCVYPGCATPSPAQAVDAPDLTRNVPYLGL